ncbi:MAG: GNAT family N-acetyltransferase [Lentisphaeria bacterium]|nr:GNAT family N-acetyltransferase [Lentisphaeria bacterium]
MMITPVTSKDEIAAVAALAHEIWNQHFTPIIGEAQVSYMLDKFQSAVAITRQIADGAEYYQITCGKHAAGYFCLVPEADAGTLLISKLYVRRADRGRGLGRQALTFVQRRARELGLSKLRLTVNRHNARSIDWYRHVGFKITGTQKKDIGDGFVMDDFLMEKAVS